MFVKKQAAPKKAPPKRKSSWYDQEALAKQLERNEASRELFMKCSGMHTKPVLDVVAKVCRGPEQAGCTDGIEFVIPALYIGPKVYLDQFLASLDALAVVAAFFLSFTLGSVGGFYAPTDSNHIRASFSFGLFLSVAFFVMNIGIAVLSRVAAASLMRDSDVLVWLYRARYLGSLNVVFIFTGIMGLVMATIAGMRYIWYGDACLDGSVSFMKQWDDWWYADDPKTSGWTKYMKNHSLSKDDAEYHEYNSVFMEYELFMQAKYDLQGTQCYGPDGLGYAYVIIPLCFFPFLVFMVYLILTRNVVFYWMFRRDKTDPYDLTVAFEEYKIRADIGRELAARDVNGDGWVNPVEHFAGLIDAASTDLGSKGRSKVEVSAEFRAVFNTYDRDASGFVDAGELSTLLSDLGLEVDDMQGLKILLGQLDVSGDGRIDGEELETWFRTMKNLIDELETACEEHDGIKIYQALDKMQDQRPVQASCVKQAEAVLEELGMDPPQKKSVPQVNSGGLEWNM